MNENVFDKNDFKKLMRDMRKKSNKTKEQIAEELGVSRQTISNWESGKSLPDAVSFLKFMTSYDPSMSDIKKLLSQGSEKETDEETYDEQRVIFEICKKQADEYFAKDFGMVSFDVDSFYKEVREKSYDQKNNYDDISSHDKNGKLIILDKMRFMLRLLACPVWNNHISERVDFPYIFTTLILRLKAKGYDVRETNMASGDIRLFILNDGKNEHLGSIILEHLLINDCRLEDLTTTEHALLKSIFTEYEEINKKATALSDKLYPIISGIDDEIYRNIGEYTLLLGYDQGDKEICAWDIIHTSDTPEELSEYITSHAKELEPLADNKDSFLVIGDHHDCDITFTANSGPKELPGTGLKFYRVDCTPSDEEPENE